MLLDINHPQTAADTIDKVSHTIFNKACSDLYIFGNNIKLDDISRDLNNFEISNLVSDIFVL
jgi:hypothetical protein